MSDDLKKCPFCGGEASVEQVDRGGHIAFSVGCSDDEDGHCMGFQSLQTFARRAEAIAAWNRRATPSDQSVRVGGEGNGSSNASPSAALHGANLDAEPSAAGEP